ncbi:MAG: hypothetical protein R2713_19345 [Ilumatobacteraceae bacterium]
MEDYRLLVNQSLDDMLAGGGEREVFGAEHKRHPADFACCGSCRSRASHRGRHRGVTVGRAGTASAS